jgi:hypothetical protein
MESQPWSIHGEIIDTCNCEVICPCTVGAPATEGKCLGNVVWAIDQGQYGAVDLTGLAVVIAVYAPGPKFDDGHWRVALYGDERATTEQRGALETIFLGQAGGFFDVWRQLTAEVVGVKWVPIQVERVGRKRTVRIGEVLDIEGEGLTGPQAASGTQLVNPPFWKGAPFPANLGRSSRFRYQDFDLHWEAPGKTCSFSEFRYEGP